MSILLTTNMLGAESPRLPIDGLPYQVQNIVTTYAKALNCPIEFVVGAAMAAAAQAAGDRFLWDNGVHKDYPQFYMAIVGDSTANKTGAIRKMFKPLIEADTVSLEQRRDASKGMSKEEKARMAYTINLLQDATTEAYQDALKFNSRGVTLSHDELLSFFDFNRYRKGNDEKFYCSMFANYDPYKIARKGNGIDYIQRPIVRVIGGIQPDVLASNFARSEMISDGMLPRFLWCMTPDDFLLDSTGVYTDTWQAETHWNNIINLLLRQEGMVRLVFDDDAQRAYNDYLKSHIEAKNAKSLYGYEAAVCGKLEIYAIIWAMTSRILRAAAEKASISDSLTILGYDMRYSLRCMDYFRHTAMRVYETITTDSIRISKKDWVRVGYQNGFFGNQSLMAELVGWDQSYVNKIVKGER